MKRMSLLVALIPSLIILGTAPPADATSAGVGVFTGTANAGPMAWPVGTACGGTVILGPVEACPSATGEGLNFAGSGVGAGTRREGGLPGAAGPVFSIGAAGTLNNGLAGGAWCDAFGGAQGTGFASFGTEGYSLADVNWIQSPGSLVPYSGAATESDGSSGVVAGVLYLVPRNPVTGGGSCLSGTGATYVALGMAAIAVS